MSGPRTERFIDSEEPVVVKRGTKSKDLLAVERVMRARARKALDGEVKKYSEDQPRDDHGRFSFVDDAGSGELSTDRPIESGGGRDSGDVRAIAMPKTFTGEKGREKRERRVAEEFEKLRKIKLPGNEDVPPITVKLKSEEQGVANLEALFSRASQEDLANANWYRDQAGALVEELEKKYGADLTGITRDQITAVVALNSPNTAWERSYRNSNQANAETVIKAWAENRPVRFTQAELDQAHEYAEKHNMKGLADVDPNRDPPYTFRELANTDHRLAMMMHTTWPKVAPSEGGAGWGWGGLTGNALTSIAALAGHPLEEVMPADDSKVRSFYNNIRSSLAGGEADKNDDAVTVDVHMLRAIFDNHDIKGAHYSAATSNAPRYEAYRRMVATAAANHGMSPKQFQAVVWHTIRREVKAEGKEEDIDAMSEETAKRKKKGIAKGSGAKKAFEENADVEVTEDEMVMWFHRFIAHERGIDVDDDPIFGKWDENDEEIAAPLRAAVKTKADFDQWLALILKYDPDQARDELGRWASEGGAGGDIADADPEPRRERITRDEARTLMAKIAFQGGFSYRPVALSSPTKGFVVSPYEKVSESYAKDELTEEALVDFAFKNRDLLNQDDHYFGAWDDGKRIYLDVSITKPSRDEAIKLASEHDQIAVWDIERGEQIVVNAEAMSGGARKMLLGFIEILKYSEDQPRDELGRFAHVGGAGSIGPRSAALREATDQYAAAAARGNEMRDRERLAREREEEIKRREGLRRDVKPDRDFHYQPAGRPGREGKISPSNLLPHESEIATPAYNPDADIKQPPMFPEQFDSRSPEQREAEIGLASQGVHDKVEQVREHAAGAEEAAYNAREMRDAIRNQDASDPANAAARAMDHADEAAAERRAAGLRLQEARGNLEVAIGLAAGKPDPVAEERINNLRAEVDDAKDQFDIAANFADEAREYADEARSAAGNASSGGGSGGGGGHVGMGSSYLLHDGSPIHATPGEPTSGTALNPVPEQALGVAVLSGGVIGSPDSVRALVSGVTDPDTAKHKGGGVSGTFQVKTEDGQTLFVKPAAGISSVGRHGIPPGGDMQREMAAQTVNEALGGVVKMPVVAIRDDVDIGRGPEVALVQEFMGPDKVDDYSLDSLTSSDFKDGSPPVDVGAFDFIIGNADRHQNQGGRLKDGSYVYWDHGLAFGSAGIDRSGNYGIMYSSANKEVSEKMKSGIDDIVLNRDNKWTSLRDKLLAAPPWEEKPEHWKYAVNGVRRRAARIRDNDYRVPTWNYIPWAGTPEAVEDLEPFDDDK